jgi:CHAD domain-containing protein
VRAARHAASSAAADQGLSGTAVLLLRLTRRVQELEESIGQAGPLYATERIHRVRIAVKKLRYAFELARDLRLLASRRVLPALRSMQETLGRLHDLQVLGARVDDFRSRLTPSEPHAAALDALAAQLDAECRALHARYLARRLKLVEAADEALADVAARSATAREGSVARPVVH